MLHIGTYIWGSCIFNFSDLSKMDLTTRSSFHCVSFWNICFIFLSLLVFVIVYWKCLIFQMSWKQERGFLPLSVALLSSSMLRSEVGHIKDIFMDIASSIEAIILSLLFCRSGLLMFLSYFKNFLKCWDHCYSHYMFFLTRSCFPATTSWTFCNSDMCPKGFWWFE